MDEEEVQKIVAEQPAFLDEYPVGSAQRLMLADSFLNPQFKMLVKKQIKDLKGFILNVDPDSDTALKDLRKFKEHLFIWEQLEQASESFAAELPNRQNSKRRS